MNELGIDIDLPERRGKTRNSMLGVIGACALVWYLLGLAALSMTIGMSADKASALYSSEQLQYVMSTSKWIHAFNAISIGAGLIGSVYILLRKVDAYKWYMLSLISFLVLITDAAFRGGFKIMDSSHFGISIIGIIIAVYLFWASYLAKNKGELRKN